MKRSVITFLLPLIVTGCVPSVDGFIAPSLGCPDLRPSDFVGSYEARLRFDTSRLDAAGTLELRADGSFAERVVMQDGKVFKNRGNWRVDEDSIFIGPLTFDMKDAMTPVRGSAGLPVRCSMRKLSEFGIDEFQVYVRKR